MPHVKNNDASSGAPPFTPYHWLYTRGLGLRAAVAIFIWWNILAFPKNSLPHAWISGVMLLAVDGLAWLAQRRSPDAIMLWAMITTAFDLVLGAAILIEFSPTTTSSAPALLPLVAIELIAYWGWIGYGIAAGYVAILIVSIWPYSPGPSSGNTINHIIFWLATNFLIITSVALLLHRAPQALPAPSPLTAREREVYDLLKSGFSQRDIAERLHIERSTVKSHIQHIHRKMGLGDPPDE
nr:LuxR C-terminal-related transcriptional regulator [Sulfobacillus harzensis]